MPPPELSVTDYTTSKLGGDLRRTQRLSLSSFNSARRG
jgi:hypothetical protein